MYLSFTFMITVRF